MLKFTFGILILLISGFISSQVYTLKTDPDKDKYPEAFNTLNDLRSKAVYQNGTYIDISDEEIKSYLNIKGINQNYIEVINSYFDLVIQYEMRNYKGNNKFESVRDDLRKSRSKFSPYGSSKLIIYKGNSVPYKTLLTSDPYSWDYEKEKNLPLNNLENETLLNLLKFVISDNKFYHSVLVTKEIKKRIELGKFSDSELKEFKDLSKNEINTSSVKVNGIQIEYKILFSKTGGREFGIDEKTETLNDLDLEIGDLESLKVITEKDGQKDLAKILDQLIEKKKNKTVISSPNNNNNKTWVHSKGKFERSNEKNPKGELIWTEDNGRFTYYESSFILDKKEYNLYRKNEPNVKLVVSDKSIYYYDNNNVKGFLLFNGGWENENLVKSAQTNSTSNQESESKAIGKNETSIISFEEFKTKANNIADVNERFKYRVEIMNLAKNTDIKLLPRHISSFCFDIYECIGNGSFNKIESRFCELGKTLTEISCEAILTDGLEKDVNKEVFKFNSLIYVFCSAKISTSREAYNMKIINGILNNYTAETYYNEFYKNLKDLFTDEKKANSSQYQVNLEKYVTTQLEKVKQSYSDAWNNMYSNGRKFSQSEYQQDYKCKYCPDGKIIGGWKNGVDEKKKKYDPINNHIWGEEEKYTPQYLRKRFPYCSPKCAKEDNE